MEAGGLDNLSEAYNELCEMTCKVESIFFHNLMGFLKKKVLDIANVFNIFVSR